MIKCLARQFLHVYRDLLRAATYLPDSAARTYVHNYVRRRFRAAKSSHETAERDSALDKRHLLKAQQNARNIWRAVNGDPPRLRKIIYLVYGRAGKRRRVLVDELLRGRASALPIDSTVIQRLIQDKPAGHVSDDATQKAPNPENALIRPSDPQNVLRKLPHPTSMIGAFIDSQITKHPRYSPRSTLRVRRPTLPETGARGKPLALRRQRNILRKWWAETLDRLLPPVPMNEWERLRDLAIGQLPVEKPIARRSRPLEDTRSSDDEALLKFLTMPAHLSAPRGELVLEEKGLLAVAGKDQTVIRTFSARSMRRLYHTVWALTPTMEFDQIIKRWKVRWGGEKPPTRRKTLPQLSNADLELFEEPDKVVRPSP